MGGGGSAYSGTPSYFILIVRPVVDVVVTVITIVVALEIEVKGREYR